MNDLPPCDEPGPHILDSLLLDAREAQALVRLVEAGQAVVQRPQFFVWMRSHVQTLLPHLVSVCGAYNRQRKQLIFKVFNSIVLPPQLLDALGAEGSPLLERAVQHWADGGGRAFTAPLSGPSSPWNGLHLAEQLAAHGVQHVMAHGVCRPDRVHELETLFLLFNDGPAGATQKLELLIPQLHATYLRSVTTERSLAPLPARAAAPQPTRGAPLVTERELHILHWVREGKSNQEIAQLLDISALTVKNHIHKILGKLGANNRAHAVTLVARLGLLPGTPQRPGNGG